MAQCGNQVGYGVVSFPCTVEVDGGPHAGPCFAIENMRSVTERTKWEEARARAEASGVPTVEELGMQGPPKTSLDGLMDLESRQGRNLHPDEQRRIREGFDLSRTEEQSLESQMVRTAGGVDISGASATDPSLSSLAAQVRSLTERLAEYESPEAPQISDINPAPHAPGMSMSEAFQILAKMGESDIEQAIGKPVREGDQPLPRKTSDLHVHDLVIEDIIERKQVGIDRYGLPLGPFNGRNAAQDAYEEALDLTAYFRQVLLERDAAAVALYQLTEMLEVFWVGDLPEEMLELLQTIANALV